MVLSLELSSSCEGQHSICMLGATVACVLMLKWCKEERESSGKTCMHFVACFVWAPVARKKIELDQLMES